MFYALAALLIAFRLAVTADLTLQVLYGPVDDGLYVSRAFHLLQGEAFGPYDSRLLAKLPGLSLWMAGVSWLGIPYLLSIGLLYAGAGLYFTARYWWLGPIWTWIVGMLVAFMGGILTYRIIVDAHTFARLARSLPAVDLLDRESLLPFARQGLRSAVPGVIFVTFFSLNLGDVGFQFASGWIMAAVLVQNAAVLVLPMRGVHDRLRAAKRNEIARVNAAIRGEPGALSGSPLGSRDRLALADLLAWRAYVEAVPEWPIDVSTLSRSVLYVIIPLLGWVGAALVQHVLDSALG